MRRTLLPLLTGLGLTLALTACGDDSNSTASCGAGTHLENGVCVVDAPTDTFTGEDTLQGQDTNTTPTDTLVAQDTGPVDTFVETDTFDPNSCTAEEAGSRDVGVGCTKHCQCRQDIGLTCYNGPLMEGFSFCTKPCAGLTNPDSTKYECLSRNSECKGYDNTEVSVYGRICNTFADCQAVSAQYTHCGTKDMGFPHGACGETCCPRKKADGTYDGLGMSLNDKVCIVATTPPFNIYQP